MKQCNDDSNGDEYSNSQRSFLATVQHQLGVQCCRILAQQGVCTGKHFLDVARRGRSPPRRGLTASDTSDGAGRRDELSTHLTIYRSVRSAVAASCALGHRSCHLLWGPQGCGSHRLLRLVAEDCRQQKNTFVLYLDGDILNSDEDALRSIGQQMLTFLKSGNSEDLRAADSSFLDGSFDFGNLFGFSRLMVMDKGNETSVQDDVVDSAASTKQGPTSVRISKTNGHEKAAKSNRKRPRAALPGELFDDDSSEDDEAFCTTSTSSYALGGVSSALPALQRSLLLMRTHGTNLVVCIRRVERFGVWCDQLLYVLSGLMHESDGQGGGMSLVMTSLSPDIRQLEKRLSSRLTCEARCIPLLPWSVGRLSRACLMELQDRLSLKTNAAKTKKTKSRKPKKKESAFATDSGSCTISHSFTGWRMGAATAFCGQDKESAGELGAYLSPEEVTLIEAAMLEMTGSVLAELSAAESCTQHFIGDTNFAQRATMLSGQLRSVGATAGKVMAATCAIFRETCSGNLPLLSRASCNKLFSWFGKHLSKTKTSQCCRNFVCYTAPDAVRALWLAVPTKANQTGVPAGKTFQSHSLLVDDLLSDCKLVKLGYCTREMFLLLTYIYLRHEAGVVRTVVDLLEDVASTMGTQAASTLDRAAFTTAVGLLHRWRIVRVGGRDGSTAVSLRGSPARLREFLQEVLQRSEYCSEALGLDTREVARLHSLV